MMIPKKGEAHKKPYFAPELLIPKGTYNIDFYKNIGAKEHFIFRNDDQSVHVAELEIDGVIFYLHETMDWFDALDPISANGVTTVMDCLLKMFKISLTAQLL